VTHARASSIVYSIYDILCYLWQFFFRVANNKIHSYIKDGKYIISNVHEKALSLHESGQQGSQELICQQRSEKHINTGQQIIKGKMTDSI